MLISGTSLIRRLCEHIRPQPDVRTRGSLPGLRALPQTPEAGLFADDHESSPLQRIRK